MSISRRDFVKNSLLSVFAVPALAQSSQPVRLYSEGDAERNRPVPVSRFLESLPNSEIVMFNETQNQRPSRSGTIEPPTIEDFANLLPDLRKAFPQIRSILTDYFPANAPEEEKDTFERTGLIDIHSTPEMFKAFAMYPNHPSCYALAQEAVRKGYQISGLLERANVELADPAQQIADLFMAGAAIESLKEAAEPELRKILDEIPKERLQTDQEYAQSQAEEVAANYERFGHTLIYRRGTTLESTFPNMLREELSGYKVTVVDVFKPSVDVLSQEIQGKLESALSIRDIRTLNSMKATSTRDDTYILALPPQESK